MKKILIFAGTRPEVIKLAPIYSALKSESVFETFFISTGQHMDLMKTALDDFGITPDYVLTTMRRNQSLNELSSLLLREIGALIDKNPPNLVIVQGDTASSLIAALAAFNLKIPIAHIEAGLRSMNKFEPFPEEMNRRIISQLANLHFAPTSKAAENLLNEKISAETIYCTGNTGIDSLFFIRRLILNNTLKVSPALLELLNDGKSVFVTMHRRENFGKNLRSICGALKAIAMQHQEVNFIFPVHPNPNVRKYVLNSLSGVKNIKLIDPLSFSETVAILLKVKLVMTDSGGLQEEGPSLGRRVIVFRDATERSESVDAGMATLVGADESLIIETFDNLINLPNEDATERHLFGRGDSAHQINEILKLNAEKNVF